MSSIHSSNDNQWFKKRPLRSEEEFINYYRNKIDKHFRQLSVYIPGKCLSWRSGVKEQ